MKTKELVKYLSKLDQELEVLVFVEGQSYHVEIVQEFKEEEKEFNEIGCGWVSIDWEEV